MAGEIGFKVNLEGLSPEQMNEALKRAMESTPEETNRYVNSLRAGIVTKKDSPNSFAVSVSDTPAPASVQTRLTQLEQAVAQIQAHGHAGNGQAASPTANIEALVEARTEERMAELFAEFLMDIKLPFLTPEPQHPRQQIIFDLGKDRGGMLRAFYHQIEFHDGNISLLFDNRYKGPQYIPAPTPAEQYISVTLPREEEGSEDHYDVLVVAMNQVHGCLDVVNLAILRKYPAEPNIAANAMAEMSPLKSLTEL